MLLNNKYEYNPKTDLVGSGGFGKVYKARDILLDREVALKIVTIEGEKAAYSLVEEVKKVIHLSHPNTIRYYELFVIKGTNPVGEETETQVGVMEYIAGGHIDQLDWNSLSKNQQTDILFSLIDGLGYLHKNHIIHRDIKPSNILIKKEVGKLIPKITDFGISKQRGESSAVVSKVIGSIPYMAPEQFNSKGKIDFNSDLWSLGVLIYKLFINELPFGDENTTSNEVIMNNIAFQPLPNKIGSIPSPFMEIIKNCLVKDRKLRVSSAEEILMLFEKQTLDHSNLEINNSKDPKNNNLDTEITKHISNDKLQKEKRHTDNDVIEVEINRKSTQNDRLQKNKHKSTTTDWELPFIIGAFIIFLLIVILFGTFNNL